VNAARAERGLVALRPDSRVWDLAGDRAAVMASRNVLSHTVAGNVGSQLSGRGIKWYRWGEDIAYTSTTRGTAATADLFARWKGSKAHWDLLMSPNFNYIGIGMAYRSSNHRTFGAVVMIDGPDRTRARGAMVDVTRTDNDLRWTWRGWDPILQTRTSGVATYEVQYRVDWGTFRTLTTATASTAWNAADRARGHTHGVRVRARDRAGNLGPWSAELRVWVP
jgi:hypothetical protein